MKKNIIVCVALFCSVFCFGQVKFSLLAGLHQTSTAYSVNGSGQSTSPKYGFHLETGVKIPFENKLFFFPALSYKLMGYKVSFDRPSLTPDSMATNNSTRFHEIDLDFLLQYDFSTKPDHFFFKAGPSLEFILAGKEKFDIKSGETVDRKMKFSVVDHYGPYGASAILKLGYETADGLIVSAQYAYYLVDMNNTENGPVIMNHLIGVSFGKFLKTKK